MKLASLLKIAKLVAMSACVALVASAESMKVPFDAAHWRKAAGYFIINSSTGLKTCSGFLIGEKRAYTNNHCIKTQDDCRNSIMVFTSKEGRREAEYRCKRLLHTVEEDSDRNRVDGSVVELDGEPGWDPDYFKPSRLDLGTLNAGTELFMMTFQFATIVDGEKAPEEQLYRCFMQVDMPDGKNGGNPNYMKSWISYKGQPCPVKPGNSGGVILDREARFVGIVSEIKAKKGYESLNRYYEVEARGSHIHTLRKHFGQFFD